MHSPTSETRVEQASKTCWASCTPHNVAHFFISPVFFAFMFFVCGLYCNSVLQIVADRQHVHCGPSPDGRCPPLPDLGHSAFPHLPDVSICDYWLYACVGLTLFRFSPLFISASLSLVMFRRWMFLQGMLFWMRGISVALTRLSVPQEDCVSTATGEAWVEGFYIMFGIHRTCGDIMFSGHTVGITLAALMWTHYSKGEEFSMCCGEIRPYITPNLDAVGDPATCTLTSFVVWGIVLAGYFFIIATRFHYSADVFIGCLLAQLVFRVFHFYIKTVLELPGQMAKFFRWFEGFDKALTELPAEYKGRERSYNPIGWRSMVGGQLNPALLKNEAARQAKAATLGRNEDEAVTPLAGVGVAIFSEGPKKEAAKAQGDSGDFEARGDREKQTYSGTDHTNSWAGEKQLPAAIGAKESFSSARHDRPMFSPVRGSSDATTTESYAPYYHYHALGENEAVVRSSQQSFSSTAGMNASTGNAPVVVAGEIASANARKAQREESDSKV